MIKLTRFNGRIFVLNYELIETIEETPDTVITTINGKKIIVRETADEIIDRVIKHKKKIIECFDKNC
jgi:flagellar protein FlbD